MAEQVKPVNPPHHKLITNIQNELDTLLKEYELQFMKDEMSIRTTPLTNMMIDMEIQTLSLRNLTSLLWTITNG